MQVIKMRTSFLIAYCVFLLSGCASMIMEGYKGKTLLDVVADYGMPSATFDAPDGSRAFVWSMNVKGVIPGQAYTTGVANFQGSSANFFSSTYVSPPTTYSYDCNYIIFAKKESNDIQGPAAWKVVGYKQPRLACE